MKVISPLTMTDAQLSATNMVENDHPEWDQSTTYAQGDRVIVLSTHKIYESVQAGNLDNDPTTDDGTWWTEISATNIWKAFDQKISVKVENAASVNYEIVPATRVTGIAFFGLEAESVQVWVDDDSSPSQEIYNVTKSLIDTTSIVDWFTYFTWEPEYDTEALFVGVPAYVGNTISIVVSAPTTAKVGQIVLGEDFQLGETTYGTEIGIVDFSTKDRDNFGNAVLLERAYAQTVTFQFAMRPDSARRVQRVLSAVRAKPAVYYAGEDITQYGATVFGFYQDFDIPLSAGMSFATLEIEGLV